MNRRMAVLALLLGQLLWLAPASASDVLAGEAPTSAVMSAVHAQRWDEAAAAAARFADPVAAKLVVFYRALTPAAAGAGEIADFIAANPDWPQQDLLARRRDEALAATADDAEAARLCARITPTLPGAMLRCASAEAASAPDAAATAARAAWRAGIASGRGDAPAEADFLVHWARLLTQQDQSRRLDRLLPNSPEAASRQVARLDASARRVADARLALERDAPEAGALLAALGPAERAEPGLLLDAARFLRRAGQIDAELALFRAAGTEATASEHSAALWSERERLARALLQRGDAAAAADLVDAARPAGEEARLDAAFLSGYIALTALHDPVRASARFTVLTTESHAAITQARGHYWLARAAAGDPARAAAELAQAAAWPTTFYGQLAILAQGADPAGLNARIRALRDPVATRAQGLAFAGHEVARAAALLVAWGEPRRARPFLTTLAAVVAEPEERALAAQLSLAFGMPDQAVMIARRAGRSGLVLAESGWPLAADPPPGLVAPAVALGVIRQESGFDPEAVSPAGARGLMQLLPATAAEQARKLGAPVSAVALTTDSGYNLRLGGAYLAELIDRFSGTLPLALAAYNAGPTNVHRWLDANGDPRAGALDTIDWIERIPLAETRNYVERVIENIAIYRARRGEALAYPLPAWRPH